MYSEDIKNELISRLATFQVEYDLLLIKWSKQYPVPKKIKEELTEAKKMVIFYQKELDKM
jgi:hypothetical protein